MIQLFLSTIGLPVDEPERNGKRTALFVALSSHRLFAVSMLLRFKASVNLGCGWFGRDVGSCGYARTSMCLAVKLAQRSKGEGALKLLLEHCICPFQKLNRRMSPWGIPEWKEYHALSISGVLCRVLRKCHVRCRCDMCERESMQSCELKRD